MEERGHLAKHLAPISSTLTGISLKHVKPASKKASSPMLLRREPSPRVTRVSCRQPKKHLFPILSTLAGRVTGFRLEQFSKALSSIAVRQEPSSQVTEKRDVQFEKHFTPTLSTLAGRAMDRKAEPKKASSPILAS
jgi:hypothetical protein